jgi:hypothetical protein
MQAQTREGRKPRTSKNKRNFIYRVQTAEYCMQAQTREGRKPRTSKNKRKKNN